MSQAGFELTSRCVKIGPGNVTVLTRFGITIDKTIDSNHIPQVSPAGFELTSRCVKIGPGNVTTKNNALLQNVEQIRGSRYSGSYNRSDRSSAGPL